MPYKFLLEDQTLSSFLTKQFAQLGLFFVAWYVLFPEMLKGQLAMGLLAFLLAFLLTHLCWCLFEFFFHRYVLHLTLFPFLETFKRKHNAHHELTYVRKLETATGTVIKNDFPIVRDDQRPHSAFPWWTLAAFFAVNTPLIFLLQWLLPTFPILLSGYVSIFVSYVGYEVIHAYEHRSYDLWWKPRIAHPRFGRYWQRFYAFHVNHHVAPRANESISGFLGFPLADWIFGTYKKTSVVMIDGAKPGPHDFSAPEGYLIIRTLYRLLHVSQK